MLNSRNPVTSQLPALFASSSMAKTRRKRKPPVLPKETSASDVDSPPPVSAATSTKITLRLRIPPSVAAEAQNTSSSAKGKPSSDVEHYSPSTAELTPPPEWTSLDDATYKCACDSWEDLVELKLSTRDGCPTKNKFIDKYMEDPTYWDNLYRKWKRDDEREERTRGSSPEDLEDLAQSDRSDGGNQSKGELYF